MLIISRKKRIKKNTSALKLNLFQLKKKHCICKNRKKITKKTEPQSQNLPSALSVMQSFSYLVTASHCHGAIALTARRRAVVL